MMIRMNTIKHYFSIVKLASLTVVFVVSQTFLHTSTVLAAVAPPVELPQAEIMRLGERMYRDGILPSGQSMQAFIRGDVAVDSGAFSCSSCHVRSGLGSVEGGVVTPPTNGDKLYKPYRRPPSLNDIPDRAGRYIYAKTTQERPAYTRATLAAALRDGVDPTGEVFNDIMPRYPLSESDMNILISYLEALSAAPSPGAAHEGFAFATIITDDVSAADRSVFMAPLDYFIDDRNQQVKMYKDFIYFGYTPTVDMKYAFRAAELEIWELKGPPTTWKKQLADYYAKKPVFAVLGGISNQPWQPIHEFCEAQRLPCLFPITDFPVISSNDWYTFYFNKGYAQEGEATARYLNRQEGLTDSTRILQIVQDTPAGRALADGFQQTWSEIGRPSVSTVTLTGTQLADPKQLARVVAEQKPEFLLLWSESGPLPGLPALLAQQGAPRQLFVSSTLLGKQTLTIPEATRDKVFISYPYRLTPYVGPRDGGSDSKVPLLASSRDFGEKRISSRTLTMLIQSVYQGLNLLYDNLYRDYLLDLLSMQMDRIVRDYERISFGPGQRYVSKGCYIIQLGPGAEPALIPKSEWVIQ